MADHCSGSGKVCVPDVAFLADAKDEVRDHERASVFDALKELVRLAKLRWRVERDYQELKEEIGLDHFEGRNWRGFHHHVTLCAAAHAFLALNRALFPPRARRWTLPMVRRQLQLVLPRRIGSCPLCRQRVDGTTLPRGPSRM